MLKTAIYKSLRPLFSVQGVEEQYRLVKNSDPEELSHRFLTEILSFAADTVPYYRERLGNRPELETLLPLDKTVISRHFDSLKSSRPPASTYLNSSGGSTGKPQTFLQDMLFSSWSETAQEYYYREFLGIEPARVRKVVLWGSERDTFRERDLKGKAVNWLTNTLFLNSFQVTPEQWIRYVELINRFRPYYIRGYASSLYQLAKTIREQNLKVHHPHFVYSSAESLLDFMRTEIEETLGARVVDYYGSREVGALAGQCPQGHHHIFSFHNRVEIFDLQKDRPVKPGESGRIIVTNLHNHAMPLLRYEIGDVGSLGQQPCTCGSRLPWLAELKGRLSDHFTSKEGNLIHGEYFTHLFYHRPWVAEFQVNQREVELVEVLVVASGEPNQKDIEDISKKIRFVLGESCQVEWKYLAEIPKTPQGKHLFTRSLIKKK